MLKNEFVFFQKKNGFGEKLGSQIKLCCKSAYVVYEWYLSGFPDICKSLYMFGLKPFKSWAKVSRHKSWIIMRYPLMVLMTILSLDGVNLIRIRPPIICLCDFNFYTPSCLIAKQSKIFHPK